MASASRESVFGVQTSTARKNHRPGHRGPVDHDAKQMLRTARNRCRHTVAWSPSREHWPRAGGRNTGSVMCAGEGTTAGTAPRPCAGVGEGVPAKRPTLSGLAGIRRRWRRLLRTDELRGDRLFVFDDREPATQRVQQLVHRRERWNDLAALDLADLGLLDTRAQGELLLAEVRVLAGAKQLGGEAEAVVERPEFRDRGSAFGSGLGLDVGDESVEVVHGSSWIGFEVDDRLAVHPQPELEHLRFHAATPTRTGDAWAVDLQPPAHGRSERAPLGRGQVVLDPVEDRLLAVVGLEEHDLPLAWKPVGAGDPCLGHQ